MHYVIQAYMFDALFSVTQIHGDNQQNRTDISDYTTLLKECYAKEIFSIIITGDNEEYLQGLVEGIKILENEIFDMNKIQF